jgi:hypothetical protein
MKNLRYLVPAFSMVLAILACSSLPVASPPTLNVATVVAATLQSIGVPTAVSAPTQAPSSGIPFASAGISLVIPEGLASGATSETVPEVTDQGGAPWEVAPAFTRLTLQAYPLQGKFFQPQIMVYPAPQYAAVGTGAAISIQRLQAILSSSSPSLGNDVLPRLPYANADQIIGAQPVVIPFNGGSGVRVLAEYAQAFSTINNQELFYHFQGLTSDGKYYIVTTLPVNAAFLAAESDPSSAVPSDGIPFPGLDASQPSAIMSYYQAVSDLLNTTAPEAFQPSLSLLDALIRSLQVTP